VQRIPRRRFFAIAAGAAAWVACSREDLDPAVPTPDPERLSLAPATIEIAVGDRRFAFGIYDGRRPFAPEGAKITLSPPDSDPVTVEPRMIAIDLGVGGNDPSSEAQRLLVVDHPFDTPGFWSAEAVFERDGRERSVTSTFSVLPDSTMPMVGEPALRTQSPTTSNPRGVDPICTRDPVCSMHDMTVAEAVTSGRPSVISFATPRFCASRTCGPAVDVVEAGKRSVGDEVAFVHVEIYSSLDATPANITEAVREWQLPGEPWVFLVAADGNVRARWSGAVGPEEFTEALQALRAGTL
jgi:hypothetical protein